MCKIGMARKVNVKKVVVGMLLLAAIFVFAPAFTLTVNAVEPIPESNLTWEFNENTGVLTIQGVGSMPNFYGLYSQPWLAHRDSITSAVITNGVTTIGTGAFSNNNITSVTLLLRHSPHTSMHNRQTCN